MEQIKDKEYFKKLAKQLMFELTDDEANDIVKEFETLSKQMTLLEKIDTTNVEEMVYPFETPTTFLREDKMSQTISQADAISNATKTKEGHFVVPKVVK